MEKEREENAGRAHVVLLPFSTQGHINPMLEFGKRLAARGLQVTVAVTRFVARSTPQPEKTGMVRVVGNISDGHDDVGLAGAESVQSYLDGFKAVGSRTLAELIREEDARGRPVRAVVYDAFLPWALDVAKGMGLLAAAFFTQSCAVNAVYHHAWHGRLSVPALGPTVSIEGLPALSLEETPSFISRPGHYPAYLDMVIKQFSNLEMADAVFVNTFYDLEPQEASWMASVLIRTKTIGPTIPTMYLLGSRGEEDKNYGFDMCTEPERGNYVKWLEAQEEPASTIYVSFGSLLAMSEEQMEELAWGLVATGKRFLWVVRGSEEGKLPEGFASEAAEKGLVVRWCAQLEVLAHPAVGCFVTHCGWNSTLEALSLGVPMVAVPQWTDQPTNAKYVEEAWGTGVRTRADGRGVVSREEFGLRIREVMEGKKAEEIRKNAQKWRKLAAEALGDGGTTDTNVREFVRTVVG
ncbi:hypothetical protein Taro_045703 [Colocasia esculenta]|uniref:Glycosyltransferase n=1 Tax=Colocasia esculenta TaxID=4460 RepID=A0A843X572_COLES|nr:hypothetical protein [Colocasia esculenta]